MSEPIDHHYNPIFYLGQWARNDGRVCRYHRPFDRVVASWRSPKHTGYEERLYSLEGVSEPQIIETEFFSRLDNDAAPILKHLIFHGPNGLDVEHRCCWSRFITSLELRSPHSLSEIKSVTDRNLRDVIEQLNSKKYLATKQPGDPDSVYEFALQQSPTIMTNNHKIILSSLIDNGFIGQLIINMRWAVLDVSAASDTLLTADRPYTRSHGFADPACLMGVPLSPTHLFVAANDIRQIQRLAAQPVRDTVRNSNKLMVELAVQNVYGCSEGQLSFVEKWLRRPADPPVPGVITRA